MRWLRSRESLGSWRFAAVMVLTIGAFLGVMLWSAPRAHAAPTCGAVGGGVSSHTTTDGNSHTTGSLAATADKLYLAWAFTAHLSSTPTATLSGAGLTWNELENIQTDGNTKRVTLFSAVSTGSSSGALTLSSTDSTGFGLIVVECSEAATTVAQVAENMSDAGGTSGTITFGSASAATSVVLGGMYHKANEGTNPPSGWSEQWDLSFAAPITGFEVAGTGGSVTSGQWSWTSDNDWAGIMVEVAEAPPPTTTTTEATTTTTSATTTTTEPQDPTVCQWEWGGVVEDPPMACYANTVSVDTETSAGVGIFMALCAYAVGCIAAQAVLRR